MQIGHKIVAGSRTEVLAIFRRFPTAASRVRAAVKPCRICVGQIGTGFLSEYSGFPCHTFIPLSTIIAIYNSGLVK
jgi:hypothetical protein